jgi:hypothetical protein
MSAQLPVTAGITAGDVSTRGYALLPGATPFIDSTVAALVAD